MAVALLCRRNGKDSVVRSTDTLANLAAPFTIQSITATSAGQTAFTVPGGYTVGYIIPFFKGVLLEDGDFTATTSPTITLAVGSDEVGDILKVIVMNTIQVANTRPNVYTVATLPDPTASANLYTTVFCTNLVGGPEEVFSDGSHWLRKSDRSQAN